uniref:Mitochondrial calcium uniporter regulator 1 n=1 Tax=Varanus komodoensis TaxID=61221 RepID=A0A8D2L1G3_VARKO
MVRGQAAALVVGSGRQGSLLVQRGPGARRHSSGASCDALVRFPRPLRRCLGDWKRAGFLVPGTRGGAHRAPPAALERQDGVSWAAARGSSCISSGCSLGVGARFLSLNVGRCRAVEERDVNICASHLQFEKTKSSFSLSGCRKLYFDTHAFVCLLEENGFTTQQSEIVVSALMGIMKNNMDIIYKDMVTKVQQEIALQQIMSHIGVVKKDMIILEKSEFSALRAENEDETSKLRTDSKLDFNLEKSRVKELYALNERKLLKMKTEIVELHAQQDRALTQTDRKIDTEVAGLKTMLESHKLDNIKYLAGSVFTCLTVALGFYRLWI